jgi:hypothetical protein
MYANCTQIKNTSAWNVGAMITYFSIYISDFDRYSYICAYIFKVNYKSTKITSVNKIQINTKLLLNI